MVSPGTHLTAAYLSAGQVFCLPNSSFEPNSLPIMPLDATVFGESMNVIASKLDDTMPVL